MIIDLVENAELYYNISPDIAKGLLFLKTCAHQPIPRLYLTPTLSSSVSRYETVQRGKRKWEAHDYLIDIHCVLEGAETITWAPRESLEYTGREQNEDVLRYDGDGAEFVLKAGMFCILFPNDVHITKVSVGDPNTVLKCILKSNL